jgi:hypothetical protein
MLEIDGRLRICGTGSPERLLGNVAHQGREVAAYACPKYARPQCTQRQTKAKKKSSGKPQKTQEIETRQFCAPFD